MTTKTVAVAKPSTDLLKAFADLQRGVSGLVKAGEKLGTAQSALMLQVAAEAIVTDTEAATIVSAWKAGRKIASDSPLGKQLVNVQRAANRIAVNAPEGMPSERDAVVSRLLAGIGTATMADVIALGDDSAKRVIPLAITATPNAASVAARNTIGTAKAAANADAKRKRDEAIAAAARKAEQERAALETATVSERGEDLAAAFGKLTITEIGRFVKVAHGEWDADRWSAFLAAVQAANPQTQGAKGKAKPVHTSGPVSVKIPA